ncbi:MAG: competence protein TfoX [Rhodobacterales bacterium]|nr:MAG: competence protein TfoX [Rhodobacterales bacterium]
MASHKETVEYICEQLGGAGEISSRKMFGEYGLYCDGTFIGVICDNTLFLKVTEPARQAEPQIALAPAYEGAKPSFQIPAEMLEDAPRLAAFARTVHDSLPAKGK